MVCNTRENKAIYNCLSEAPLLTVILGAKCSCGIVMVADRKCTDLLGGKPEFGMKIFGDLGHVIIGYTGRERMFDALENIMLEMFFLELVRRLLYIR